MSTTQFEEAAFAAVQAEIAGALPSIQARNLTLGQLELARAGRGRNYVAELRVYVSGAGQIRDALEVHIVREGKPAVTIDELRDWFRTQLAGLR